MDINMMQSALEFRKAVEFFAQSLNTDTELDKILTIPSLFPQYSIGTSYKTKDIFSYGINSTGDTQLYQVLQDHTSSAEWKPDISTSLYKAIGISDNGYPEWVQPIGSTDAYNKGDIVSYKGTLYCSIIDGNVWSPDAYPDGWEKYE